LPDTGTDFLFPLMLNKPFNHKLHIFIKNRKFGDYVRMKNVKGLLIY